MKPIKTIFSGEFLFALFLFAGYFKSIFTFVPIDLTFFLLLITFLIALKKLREGKKIHSRNLLLWLAFISLGMISLFYTHPLALSTNIAIEKFLRLAIISTWCFIAPFILFDGRESIKKFIIAVISLGIIMSITSFFTGQNEAGFVGVFGSNYQSLSRISGSTAIILLGVYLFSKNKLSVRLLSLVTSSILVMPMLISGGRLTAVIFLIIVLFLFPLMFFEVNIKRRKIRIYKRIYAYAITFIIVTISVFLTIKSGMLDTFLFRVGVLFKEEGGGASIAGRTERMNVAIDMISSSPFLGQGLGSFGFYFVHGILDDTPHHLFLEIWAEMGIIPLLIFLYLFILATARTINIWKLKKNDWVYTAFFLLYSFWLIATLLSSGLTSAKVIFAFMAVSIASYYNLSVQKDSTEEKRANIHQTSQ